MISGNVSSYSRLLNSDKRLKEVEEYNELAAAVGSVMADAEAEKERKAASAKQKAADKQSKKQEDAAAFKAKQEELMEEMEEVVFAYGETGDANELGKFTVPMNSESSLCRD